MKRIEEHIKSMNIKELKKTKMYLNDIVGNISIENKLKLDGLLQKSEIENNPSFEIDGSEIKSMEELQAKEHIDYEKIYQLIDDVILLVKEKIDESLNI